MNVFLAFVKTNYMGIKTPKKELHFSKILI